jgi:Mg/Co/Ni transporter MgtE
MKLKSLLLFVIVCGVDSICILLGSMLGHGVGGRALFVGAMIGGVVGVAAAVWLAVRFKLLSPASYIVTFLGGVIGFALAAVIAVKNLQGPLIPIASVALIGLGAILGKALGQKRQA